MTACNECDRLTAEVAELKQKLAAAEAQLLKYTHCWHCHDELMEDDPHYCESCPAWGSCSDAECTAPGCQADVQAHREGLAQLEAEKS